LKKSFEKICEKNLRKKTVGKKLPKIFFAKNIFLKKKIAKKFFQKIYFSKKVSKKFSRKNFVKFFLPTLVEVSSSGLKLEENEIFLLQWVKVS